MLPYGATASGGNLTERIGDKEEFLAVRDG